jgi:hypothetical protein
VAVNTVSMAVQARWHGSGCSDVASAQAAALLQVEAGTPFARWQADGRLSFPDDEAGAAMYRDASNLLRQVTLPFYPTWSQGDARPICSSLMFW